jgi:hypothetical protein
LDQHEAFPQRSVAGQGKWLDAFPAVRTVLVRQDNPAGVLSGLEQRDELGGQQRRLGDAGMGDHCRYPPGHRDGQRHPVTGGEGQLAQLLERGVVGTAAFHNAVA